MKNAIIFMALTLAFSMVVLGYVVVNSAMTASQQFIAVIILAGVVISVTWAGVIIVQRSHPTPRGQSDDSPVVMIERDALKTLINEVLEDRDSNTDSEEDSRRDTDPGE